MSTREDITAALLNSFSEIPSNMKMAFNHFFRAPQYYLKTKAKDINDINNYLFSLKIIDTKKCLSKSEIKSSRKG